MLVTFLGHWHPWSLKMKRRILIYSAKDSKPINLPSNSGCYSKWLQGATKLIIKFCSKNEDVQKKTKKGDAEDEAELDEMLKTMSSGVEVST